MSDQLCARLEALANSYDAFPTTESRHCAANDIRALLAEAREGETPQCDCGRDVDMDGRQIHYPPCPMALASAGTEGPGLEDIRDALTRTSISDAERITEALRLIAALAATQGETPEQEFENRGSDGSTNVGRDAAGPASAHSALSLPAIPPASAGTEMDEGKIIDALNASAKKRGVRGFDMAQGGMIGVIERLAAGTEGPGLREAQRKLLDQWRKEIENAPRHTPQLEGYWDGRATAFNDLAHFAALLSAEGPGLRDRIENVLQYSMDRGATIMAMTDRVMNELAALRAEGEGK